MDTAKFCGGRELNSQRELDNLMEKAGWTRLDGGWKQPRYQNRETGDIIADAHDGNILVDKKGRLWPVDVIVIRLTFG